MRRLQPLGEKKSKKSNLFLCFFFPTAAVRETFRLFFESNIFEKKLLKFAFPLAKVLLLRLIAVATGCRAACRGLQLATVVVPQNTTTRVIRQHPPWDDFWRRVSPKHLLRGGAHYENGVFGKAVVKISLSTLSPFAERTGSELRPWGCVILHHPV